MSYRVVDRSKYYRAGVFRHFTEDCRCSVSMTARIDVTDLAAFSKREGTRFYTDFLHILAAVLNSREDYRLGYLRETDELILYDRIHPLHYVFHQDTGTCTPVFTQFSWDRAEFIKNAEADIARAEKNGEYPSKPPRPDRFEASYIPWVSYDSLNIELPDGYIFLSPIVSWGRYREENGRLMMPVTVRINHAAADGFLIANVFRLLERAVALTVNGESLKKLAVGQSIEGSPKK